MRLVALIDETGLKEALRWALGTIGDEVEFIDSGDLAVIRPQRHDADLMFVDESSVRAMKASQREVLKSRAKVVVLLTHDLRTSYDCITDKICLPLDITALLEKVGFYRKISDRDDQAPCRLHMDAAKELAVLRHEMRLAETMLESILKKTAHRPSEMRVFSSSKLTVSGDVVISAETADGSQIFLVGDVSGHNLSSAVTVMAIQTIFLDEVVEKITKLDEIVVNLNNRLYEILPTEMFFAAALLKLDFRHQTIELWNAAMPDIWVVDGRTNSVKSYASDFMPLGIASMRRDDVRVSRIPYSNDSIFYLVSDGFTDHYEACVEEFNFENIVQLAGVVKSDCYQCMVDVFQRLSLQQGVADDVTIVEVKPKTLAGG